MAADLRVAVLVPWRDIGVAARNHSWLLVEQHWLRAHPNYTMVVRDGGGQPFSRAASLNLAARDAPFADIFIVADADVVTVPTQVETAVALAAKSDGMVQPFSRYIPLNPGQTSEVWGEGEVPAAFALCQIASWECISGCLAFNRRSWELVGGFDERFRGWGYEDSAFERKMAAVTGVKRRKVEGPAWHLAHAGAIEDPAIDPYTQANRVRWNNYKREYPPQ